MRKNTKKHCIRRLIKRFIPEIVFEPYAVKHQRLVAISPPKWPCGHLDITDTRYNTKDFGHTEILQAQFVASVTRGINPN